MGQMPRHPHVSEFASIQTYASMLDVTNLKLTAISLDTNADPVSMLIAPFPHLQSLTLRSCRVPSTLLPRILNISSALQYLAVIDCIDIGTSNDTNHRLPSPTSPATLPLRLLDCDDGAAEAITVLCSYCPSANLTSKLEVSTVQRGSEVGFLLTLLRACNTTLQEFHYPGVLVGTQPSPYSKS